MFIAHTNEEFATKEEFVDQETQTESSKKLHSAVTVQFIKHEEGRIFELFYDWLL
jgi:hypothetical protein